MDSDKIIPTNYKPGDLNGIFVDVLHKTNFKQIFWLFLIFILISSDIFISRIIGKMDGLNPMHPYTTNGRGTVIQGIFLVLFYIMTDIMIKTDVL